MILILGSRHDAVARDLASRWRGAALSIAEDLTRPGWNLPLDEGQSPTWVVDGTPVNDAELTGIFLRRSAVYPEELHSTHPDDRAYLAAESHAFLIAMLGRTRARVANPVCDGSIGEETLRPDRWIAAARKVRLELAPLRLTPRQDDVMRNRTQRVDIVGDRVHGEVASPLRPALSALAHELSLEWASVLLDDRSRLLAVTARLAPTSESVSSLEALLGGAST